MTWLSSPKKTLITSETLLRYSLFTAKCAFGVSSEKFLGHLVTRRGIEANPSQVVAIRDLVSPKCAKDTQKLIGIAATFN